MIYVYLEFFYGLDLRWSKNWNNIIFVVGFECVFFKRAGVWSCFWRWGRIGLGVGFYTVWSVVGFFLCLVYVSFWGGEIYGIN